MSAVRWLAAATLARTADAGSGVVIVLASVREFGGPVQGSLVLAVLLVPNVVAGPFLGVLTDRAKHPRVLHACFVGGFGAALGGVLSLLGHAPQPAVLALAAIAGCCAPMIFGGLSSRLDDVVAEERRRRFRGLDAATYNVAEIAGPAVCAALVVSVGVPAAATALAASCLAAAVLLLTVRTIGAPQPATEREVPVTEPVAAATSTVGGMETDPTAATAARTPAAAIGTDLVAPDSDRAALHAERTVADAHHAPASADLVVADTPRSALHTDGTTHVIGAAASADPVINDARHAPADADTAVTSTPRSAPHADSADGAAASADPVVEDTRHAPADAGAVAADTRGPAADARRPAADSGQARADAEGARGRLGSDLLAGLRAIGVSRPLRAVTTAACVAAFGLGMMPAVAVLLGVAHGRPTGGGVLMTAVGVGALAGSLVVARWPIGMAAHRFVLWCLMVMAAALTVSAVVDSWVALVALFGVVGLCDGPMLAAVLQVRSTEAPGRVRTQVFTIGAGLKVSMAAVGAAVFASVAAWPVEALVVGVAGTQLLGAVVGALLLGRARRR
ncbi:MFS transporter [Dactylosporangium salmoneum]|uniref:MFS transporter n=1 Tax=Dactylosporangium salmoneum TaxID=53361 RepID=A0ABP5UP56_9ACTN